MDKIDINCLNGEVTESILTPEEIAERELRAQQEATKIYPPTAEERIRALEDALLMLLG